jgi:hypothetical protein
MSDYVYNDEDNNPMFSVDGHNQTVYADGAMMKVFETGEPERKEKPENGCWNCMNFDWKHEACTLNWNNMDESYYCPDTDDRELTDCCEYHEVDPEADPECLELGGNEK